MYAVCVPVIDIHSLFISFVERDEIINVERASYRHLHPSSPLLNVGGNFHSLPT